MGSVGTDGLVELGEADGESVRDVVAEFVELLDLEGVLGGAVE